jgi:hypothetical protein
VAERAWFGGASEDAERRGCPAYPADKLSLSPCGTVPCILLGYWVFGSWSQLDPRAFARLLSAAGCWANLNLASWLYGACWLSH